MSRYRIQMRVATPAELFEPLVIRQIEFKHSVRPGFLGPHSWVATGTCNANDHRGAHESFLAHIGPIVDALSVYSRCAFSIAAGSRLIQRHDPPTDLTYVMLYRARDGTGLSLGSDDLPEITKLLTGSDGDALFYLRVASAMAVADAIFPMLVMAAESAAGTTQVPRTCPSCSASLPPFSATDKAQLRVILGERNYELLYDRHHGALRHRMFHGSRVTGYAGDLTAEMYAALVDHFRRKYNVGNMEPIVNMPRNLNAYDGLVHFVRHPDCPDVELDDLEPAAWRDYRPSGSPQSIEFVPPDPSY